MNWMIRPAPHPKSSTRLNAQIGFPPWRSRGEIEHYEYLPPAPLVLIVVLGSACVSNKLDEQRMHRSVQWHYSRHFISMPSASKSYRRTCRWMMGLPPASVPLRRMTPRQFPIKLAPDQATGSHIDTLTTPRGNGLDICILYYPEASDAADASLHILNFGHNSGDMGSEHARY
jgi:hypothetical protein